MDYTYMSVDAIRAVGDINMISGILGFLGVILILIVVLNFFKWMINLGELRKSKKYRKYLTDMFVAAKTRKYAKIDELDLDAEDIKFMNWSKKKRSQTLELDNIIEEDLSDRIAEDKFKADLSAEELVK